MPGWLVEQLPRVLSSDPFTRRFVTIFEQIADDIRDEIDGLEYYIDVDTAPPEFVRWLGAWLGATVEAAWPLDRQRAIVRRIGELFPERGTRAGLEGVLSALTGEPAHVVDGGGVWRAGETPSVAPHILVRVSTLGGLTADHLHRLIADDLPVGVTFELRMGDETMTVAPPDTRELETMMADVLATPPASADTLASEPPPASPPAPPAGTPPGDGTPPGAG